MSVPDEATRAPLDLAWAVSGRGMLVRAVVGAAEAGLIEARVVRIVTDRSCPVEPFAFERGIPVTRLTPPDHDRTRFDREIAEAFRKSRAGWAGLTFNRLIGPEAIESLEGRILNVHFSLLPLFPGFGALRRAIASGMRVAGVTIHLVDPTMDGGTILGQAVCSLGPADTEASLGRRTFEAAVPLLLQIIRDLARSHLRLGPGRAPIWEMLPTLGTRACGYPSVDPDLVSFGEDFCAAIA